MVQLFLSNCYALCILHFMIPLVLSLDMPTIMCKQTQLDMIMLGRM